MKKLLSGMLTLALVAPYCLPAQAAPADSQQSFQPNVTYEVSVTDDERAIIHDEVDKISGDVGDMKVGDGTYDPYSLIGGLATGSDYDSISYGSKAAGSVPSEYPFAVPDTEANNNEHSRKVEKLAWVKELAEELGFPVVVQRQEDKYVYIEIGDPDAPEMVMALSHLDSPTASNNEAQLERWVNAEGETGDPTSYHTPYVKDGWLYGAGVQDDSGPTLATLFAAKALMEAGLPMDRRIRIVMGCYEDSNPGVPTKEDTLKYMDIPYYTSNPSFYDNWCYKSLNREEMPIAAYTSDSRFPVVVGNSKAITPTISMDLSADDGKTFSLISAGANVTLREGDDTLKDIVYGSTSQVASRAVFTLKADSVEENNQAFVNAVTEAATKLGWLPAAEGTTPKVSVEVKDGTIVLETNTDVAMEMPTPQYGKNAVVWGMYLISQGLGDSSELQLKKAADGISDLFFRNCVEGEAYIGSYMGIPQDLLRNPDSGVANLTFALMGGIKGTEELVSFFSDNSLSIPLYIRSMHTNEENYTTAMDATVQAFHDKGFTWQVSRMEEGQYTAYSNPTLYASHDNPLIALQYASYKATMESDPEAFADVSDLLDITYPVGTTGGTLASNYLNKMTAFGAVIPGNERWWHSANERIGVDAIIEMTKLMADGMLEMARYSGPAGAQLMWADIDGLNADRADLDLLDVTIGTYQDASEAVTNSEDMLAATKFDIPMWAERGNSSKTDAQFKSGEVYLSTDDEDFQANTFVLPMRLEFKVEKPESMSQTDWNALAASGFAGFTFHIQKDGQDIPLTVPEGQDASKYFAARVSSSDPDIIYASVNLAITDAAYDGVSTVLADSKTDLYDLNDEWLESNEDPFPERGAVEERGFFLFGDGEKNARFTSPEAIYVTTEKLELVEDTILYTVNSDNQLEYNVVYDAPLASNVAVMDQTEKGIDSLAELKEVMGEADLPKTELTTDPGQRTIGDAVTADLVMNEDGAVVAITVSDVSERPIVGISWKKDTIGSDYQGFAEAYERNGAIAVYLPQVTSAEEARQVLSQIDGIFFTGGEDWNPSLYGETQSPHGSSGWNDARDTSDINLMQQAVEMDVPLLAVCRGEQGFNISRGGGLIQDVPYYLGQQVLNGEIDPERVTGILSGPSETDMAKLMETWDYYSLEEVPDIFKEAVKDTGYTMYDDEGNRLGNPYNKEDGTYADFDEGCEEGHLRVQVDGLIHSGGTKYHELAAGTDNEGVAISKDSKWLYDIVGTDSIDMIATAHHQSANPEKLGDGLTVVARSSDGIIEALEYQDATFALALQWHPERDALGGTAGEELGVDVDLCNAFLRALVTYAGGKEDEPSEGGGSSSGGSSTTITTTTDGNGTVIKVVTDKTTGTITTTMEYKNGVTVKAVENSVGVVTVNVTVPNSVDSATVTIPVKNPTTSTVAKLSKSGQVIRTGVAGKDGITLTLTESTSLTILDNAKIFSDVASGQWYAEAVNFVTSHEIFAGVGNGTFAPNSTMTRAMLWTVLYGLEGQQSAAAGQTWYSNAQDWAMKNGVSDGTNPNGSITREQIAVTLYGYAKAQGIAGTVTGDLSKFQDASSVSSWATEAMAWAVQNGLISGKDNGSLAPQDTATRAELAQIMMQFVTASVK